MANDWFFAQNGTESSTTTALAVGDSCSSGVDALTMTETFDAGDWLIIWTADIGQSNANGQCLVKMCFDGADSYDFRFSPNNSNGYRNVISFNYFPGVSSGSHTASMRFGRPAGGGSALIRNRKILAVQINRPGSAQNVFAENINSLFVDSDTYINALFLTWTPNSAGHDWIFLASAEINNLSSGLSNNVQALIELDGVDITTKEMNIASNNVAERHCYWAVARANLTAASHTLIMQAKRPVTSDDGIIRNRRLLAIDLSEWPLTAFQESESEESFIGTTFQAKTNPLEHTPQVDIDHAWICGWLTKHSGALNVDENESRIGSPSTIQLQLRTEQSEALNNYIPQGLLEVENATIIAPGFSPGPMQNRVRSGSASGTLFTKGYTGFVLRRLSDVTIDMGVPDLDLDPWISSVLTPIVVGMGSVDSLLATPQTDLVPGAIAIVTGVSGLTMIGQNLVVIPGSASIFANALDLAIGSDSLDLIPGAVSIPISTLNGSLQSQFLAVQSAVSILIKAELGISMESRSLSLIPGETAIPMSVVDILQEGRILIVVPGGIAIIPKSATMFLATQDLTLVAGAIAIPVNILDAALISQVISVLTGVNVSMGVLDVLNEPRTFLVIPGAVQIPTNALDLLIDPQSISLIPGAVQIPIERVDTILESRTLTVLPGEVQVPINAVDLIGEARTISVIPGAITVGMNLLQLIGQARTLTVVLTGGIIVQLDLIPVDAEVGTLMVVPGSISITTGLIDLGLSPLQGSVLSEVSVALEAVGLSLSLGDLSVVPGSITIPISEADLALEVPVFIVTGGIGAFAPSRCYVIPRQEIVRIRKHKST